MSAAASPVQATWPCDSTTTRSATPSATSAFCSTTMAAMPSCLRRRITPSTSSTILGARPWLGSSKQHEAGRAQQRAGNGHHLHLAARQRLGLARHQVFERREDVASPQPSTTAGRRCASRRARGSWRPSASGTAGGRRAPSRCRRGRSRAWAGRDRPALEADVAAARRGSGRGSSAAPWSCRRRWRRAAPAPRRRRTDSETPNSACVSP